MKDVLFQFEEGLLPPAVVLATGLLVVVFTLGLAIRLLLLAL